MKSGLADAVGEGGKDDGSNLANRSADTQSAVVNPQSSNQGGKAKDHQESSSIV